MFAQQRVVTVFACGCAMHVSPDVSSIWLFVTGPFLPAVLRTDAVERKELFFELIYLPFLRLPVML